MITRELFGLYPAQVAGMVLLDASSEPEVAVYDRLHAGPWIDGTVQPAPNQQIDIHATVRQLETAHSLGQMPPIGAAPAGAGHRGASGLGDGYSMWSREGSLGYAADSCSFQRQCQPG